MIQVRRAETGADLEGWIRVRRAVFPNESAWTVQEFREREDSERLVLVAELDGSIVGSGLGGRSWLPDRGFVAPRVLPGARRRGVGTALLRPLARHVTDLGFEQVSAHSQDDASRLFAERFGFEEVDRQVEQVLALTAAGTSRLAPPDGVEITTVAARPELLREAYPQAAEGYADLAFARPATIKLADWLRDEASLPEGSFVALSQGEIVGYSGLCRHDNPGTAEDGLTVVRRDWRRRGLARLLKSLEIEWAAAHGFLEIVTWTQRGNEGMRSLNERLGYEARSVSLTMLARLPLKGLE